MDRFGGRTDSQDAQVLTCPDYGRLTWELKDDALSRCRRQTGHGYMEEMITVRLDERLKRVMSKSLKALNEQLPWSASC